MNSPVEKKIKKGIVLAEFSAPWCGPCKAQAPVINKLSGQYRNRVSIVEINTDTHRELAIQHRVQSIPTLIVFKQGKEIKRLIGLQTEADIKKALDKIL